MHINCNASVLQGIIVVIVSRQCGSFCISHEYLQPPPDIIVVGPRLACADSAHWGHFSLHPLVIRDAAVAREQRGESRDVMTRGRGQGQTPGLN